ncbi:MAG TPA: hypothetical protein IGS53_12620 [Leptolyngbyaceae cyanobacterium M33_DOE_097]|nr:hypothetical protein [Leptolyngbyaceae cyanobacterium M33_DOE_097]
MMTHSGVVDQVYEFRKGTGSDKDTARTQMPIPGNARPKITSKLSRAHIQG